MVMTAAGSVWIPERIGTRVDRPLGGADDRCHRSTRHLSAFLRDCVLFALALAALWGWTLIGWAAGLG